jgi:hypothetical protein
MVHPVVGDPRLRQSIPPDPHSGGPKATPVHPPSGLKYEAEKNQVAPHQVLLSALALHIGTRHAARGTRHAARGTRHAARGTRRAARGTRHAARGTRHAARGTRHAARGRLILKAPAYSGRRSPIPAIIAVLMRANYCNTSPSGYQCHILSCSGGGIMISLASFPMTDGWKNTSVHQARSESIVMLLPMVPHALSLYPGSLAPPRLGIEDKCGVAKSFTCYPPPSRVLRWR